MSEKEKQRQQKLLEYTDDVMKNEMRIFTLSAYSTPVENMASHNSTQFKSKQKMRESRLRKLKKQEQISKGPMSLELLERIKLLEEKVHVMKEDKYTPLIHEFPMK